MVAIAQGQPTSQSQIVRSSNLQANCNALHAPCRSDHILCGNSIFGRIVKRSALPPFVEELGSSRAILDRGDFSGDIAPEFLRDMELPIYCRRISQSRGAAVQPRGLLRTSFTFWSSSAAVYGFGKTSNPCSASRY